MLNVLQNELRSDINLLGTGVQTKAMVLKVINGIIRTLKRESLVPLVALNIPDPLLDLYDYYYTQNQEIVDQNNSDYRDLNGKLSNLEIIPDICSIKKIRETINEIIFILKDSSSIVSKDYLRLLDYTMLEQISPSQSENIVSDTPVISDFIENQILGLSIITPPTTGMRIEGEINKLVNILKDDSGAVFFSDLNNLRSQFIDEYTNSIDLNYGVADESSNPTFVTNKLDYEYSYSNNLDKPM